MAILEGLKEASYICHKEVKMGEINEIGIGACEYLSGRLTLLKYTAIEPKFEMRRNRNKTRDTCTHICS